MKLIYQIVIVAFICSVLFMVRDDAKQVYNSVANYVSSKINLPSKSSNTIAIKADEISTSSQSANTPGALKVTEGLTSASKVKLSVADVITWTNKNRADNGGLEALTENAKLDESAQMKVDDMFKQQYFEHVSPDGVGVSDLGKKVDYEYIVIGENLALGNFKDAQSLLNAWMASPGHRANILNTKYTEIGVAVGHGMFRGQDTWLAVQHFGLPRSACPNIDDFLRGIIKLTQKELDTKEADLSLRREKIDSGVVYEGKTTNEQINEYNSLVGIYNQMIIDLKNKVSTYNTGVRAFNDCLAKSTS